MSMTEHREASPSTRSATKDTMVDPAWIAGLKRRRRNDKIKLHAGRAAMLLAILCFWQFLVGNPRTEPWTLLDEYYVSKPSQMWRALLNWIDQGVLLPNIGVTLQETLLGFLIGAILGGTVGFVVGTMTYLGNLLSPFISALYAVPRLALVPLFMLWFGLGLGSKVAFVAMLVFFLVFYNTYSGAKDVDSDLLDTIRVLGARRRHLHLKVILPSALTWVFAGLRISVPYALVGAVTAEMISSNRGLGYLLIRASGQFDTAGVFASIVVMMCVALALNGLVVLLEHYLLRWKKRGR
ncbi:ABC transporter permease [Actinophytocola sp.]|uniref:ABC transporter permease n=1 Tax=Actinophytocola sp. TaxID=1872138 RepID=UPI003D6AB8C6